MTIRNGLIVWISTASLPRGLAQKFRFSPGPALGRSVARKALTMTLAIFHRRTHAEENRSSVHALTLTALASSLNQLSPKWEELTHPLPRRHRFNPKAFAILPFGILEKHGPHLPLGPDLLNVRYARSMRSSRNTPSSFLNTISVKFLKRKHETRYVAYSRDLQLMLLQEPPTKCAYGCKKLHRQRPRRQRKPHPFFAQSQLDKASRLRVYAIIGERSQPGRSCKKSTGIDLSRGENETANTLVTHPDLVHLDRAKQESGADQSASSFLRTFYTGIWWYARFPITISGDGSVAVKELGQWISTAD